MKARHLRPLALLFGVAVCFAGQAAFAQTPCGDFAMVAKALLERYDEEQIGQGLSSGGVVALFASPEGGTWTLVLQQPGQPACMVAAGSDWSVRPLPAPGVEG